MNRLLIDAHTSIDHHMRYTQSHVSLLFYGQISYSTTAYPHGSDDKHRLLQESHVELDDIFARQVSRSLTSSLTLQYDIARIAAHMSNKYGVTYAKRQQILFDKWAELDPVSQEEIQRNNQIIKTQGYGLKF